MSYESLHPLSRGDQCFPTRSEFLMDKNLISEGEKGLFSHHEAAKRNKTSSHTLADFEPTCHTYNFHNSKSINVLMSFNDASQKRYSTQILSTVVPLLEIVGALNVTRVHFHT